MSLALAAVLVDDDFWVLVLFFIQPWCNACALTCQYPCHLPVLRAATAYQETSGEFAGLLGKDGGKTGGVGDIDGGYHPGPGAVSEKN
jgi:hypothetical protein